MESEIPFSQIFDVENVNEDSAIDLAFDFSDIAVEASQDFDGEIRGIKFDGDVRANIRVFNTESSENIEDAYGVSCNITAKSDALLSENLVDDIKSQLNLKDTVDLSALYAPIKNVLSMEVKTKIKDEKVEDGKLMIEGTADFDILCVTEWETFDVVKVTHSIPISFAQAIEGKTKADKTNVSAIVSGSSYNMNMAGEMEVRCVVNINAKLLKQSDIMTVCEMKVSEKIASDKKIPSMTAYFVNDKDSLWDIGKKYSVSIASIKKTNKFEENKTPKCGEMILIPR